MTISFTTGVSTVTATAAGIQPGADITSLGANYVMAWEQSNDIFVNIFSTSGSVFGGPVLVDSATVGGNRPAVTALADGTFVVNGAQ